MLEDRLFLNNQKKYFSKKKLGLKSIEHPLIPVIV